MQEGILHRNKIPRNWIVQLVTYQRKVLHVGDVKSTLTTNDRKHWNLKYPFSSAIFAL